MGCKNENFERKFPRWRGIKIIIFTKIYQMWKRILLRSDNRLYFCISIECSMSNDKKPAKRLNLIPWLTVSVLDRKKIAEFHP